MITRINMSLLDLFYLKQNSKHINIDNCHEWGEYVLYNYCLRNPQSYGQAIERRIIENNNWIRNKKTENAGDAKENNINKEIKVSITDKSIGSYNIVQIRPNANIVSYLLFFIKIKENGSVITNVFEVPKNNINSIPGLGRAHGLKTQDENQKYIDHKVHNCS